MNRFLFFVTTIALGMLVDMFCQRFLSFYGVGPQLLFLFVMAHGFTAGPLVAETLGFSWGLLADASGVGLFGMNAFLLALAGYAAGRLRRRVASERPAAQMAIAFFGSLFYSAGVQLLLHYFEPDTHRSILNLFFIGTVLNVLLVIAVFSLTERWLELWQIQPEQN